MKSASHGDRLQPLWLASGLQGNPTAPILLLVQGADSGKKGLGVRVVVIASPDRPVEWWVAV